jgi:hypothetical protein
MVTPIVTINIPEARCELPAHSNLSSIIIIKVCTESPESSRLVLGYRKCRRGPEESGLRGRHRR